MTNQGGGEYLAITATGEDRIGLVDKFTARISESGCNIEDSRMAVLGGHFAIIMLLSGPWNALTKLESQLDAIGEQLELTIIHKRTRPRGPGKALIPYHVEVVAMDHPGIVHKLASFFAARAINIEELDTDTYAAPHTGAPMFKVNMTIGIPAETHIPSLRGDFLDYCDDLNLDALFEPARS
jgi:glycine cleavage system transcriptional repressor